MRRRLLVLVGVAAALGVDGVAAQTVDLVHGVVLPGFAHDAGASFLAVRHGFHSERWMIDVDGFLAATDGFEIALGEHATAQYRVAPSAGLSVLAMYGTYDIASDSRFGGYEAGGGIRMDRPTLEAWLSWTRVRPVGAAGNQSTGATRAGVRWHTGDVRLGVTALGSTFRDSASTRHDAFGVAPRPITRPGSYVWETGLGYVDVEADASLPLGYFDVGVVAGHRQGNAGGGAETWVRGYTSLPLPNRGLRLEVSGGIRPTVPERAIPRAPFLSFGIRWWPASAKPKVAEPPQGWADARLLEDTSPNFEAVEGKDGTVRTLVLRNVFANTVEVMGDFTDWESRALTSVDPSTWSTEAELGPGTYHYLVRLDGRDWGVPRGLPRVFGEFGSETGILVVQPSAPPTSLRDPRPRPSVDPS